MNRLTTSVQSIDEHFSFTSPVSSTSYPFLKQSIVQNIQPSSAYKDPTTYASLCHLNNISSNINASLSKIDTPDDMINKSSDDNTRSTYSSNVPTTIPLDINEKHLPIEVRVRCIFLRVGEIDTLNERYTSEIFFEASWYVKDQKIGSKYDPQLGHFNPQFVVLNHMGESLRHDVSIFSLKKMI
jgi:hypothetical protein